VNQDDYAAGLCSIYVRGLDASITKRDLLDMFSQFGTITGTNIAHVSEGYAHVDFLTKEQCQAAVAARRIKWKHLQQVDMLQGRPKPNAMSVRTLDKIASPHGDSGRKDKGDKDKDGFRRVTSGAGAGAGGSGPATPPRGSGAGGAARSKDGASGIGAAGSSGSPPSPERAADAAAAPAGRRKPTASADGQRKDEAGDTADTAQS
jgi:hypothetical protein